MAPLAGVPLHRFPSLRWCLCLSVLAGCAPDRGYLGSTVDAWTEQVVALAEPGFHVAVGVSALASDLCSLDHTGWSAAQDSGVALSAPVAEWFQLPPKGEVTEDPTTGLRTATFSGGKMVLRKGEDEQHIQVLVRADVPTQALTVTVLELVEGDDVDTGVASLPLVDTTFSTTACDQSIHYVSGKVRPTDGQGATWTVDVPEGDVDQRYLLVQSGMALPHQGRMSWTGRFDDKTVTVVTDDATSIGADGLWSVSVEGRGWTGEAELDLD